MADQTWYVHDDTNGELIATVTRDIPLDQAPRPGETWIHQIDQDHGTVFVHIVTEVKGTHAWVKTRIMRLADAVQLITSGHREAEG